MNVVILHDRIAPDAREDEKDVLVQAEAVRRALAGLGHQSRNLPLSLDLSGVEAELRKTSADLVVNLVESVEGHGRLIYLAPALLDALRFPYTGAGTEAMFLTSSKLLTKERLRAKGIPTPDWVAGDSSPGDAPAETKARRFAPGTYIVKSVWEDASIGLDAASIVHTDDLTRLRQEMETRRSRLGGEAFAEAFIDGREFNLSVLEIEGEPTVLPPAEIRFTDFPPDKPRIVDYEAKWDEQSFGYTHTVRSFDFVASDADLLNDLCDLARRCWRLFGLSGYARVDFRVDENGRPWVLELNANPCLSPDAGFAAAAAQADLTYEGVVDHIIRAALRRADQARGNH